MSAAPTTSNDGLLSDTALVYGMEQRSLGGDEFHHAEHLRLAWIYLREATLDHATERIVRVLRAFACHHGKEDRYHETITRAYMRLVAAHLCRTPTLDRFAQFAEAHPDLFDKGLLLSYYSQAVLMSDGARRHWVPPDIEPLPTPLHAPPIDSGNSSGNPPDRPLPRSCG